MTASIVPGGSENDANATPAIGLQQQFSVTEVVEVKQTPPPLTDRQNQRVDDRQDQLMARDSVDGRPPPRHQRITEWKWLLIVAPVLAIACIALLITRGVRAPAIAFGVLFVGGYLLLGVWPVWRAGVLRGREEQEARKEAKGDVRAVDDGSHDRR